MLEIFSNFRTPPYWNLNIEQPVTVQYQLYRPKTGCCSDPISFKYIPRDVSQGEGHDSVTKHLN